MAMTYEHKAQLRSIQDKRTKKNNFHTTKQLTPTNPGDGESPALAKCITPLPISISLLIFDRGIPRATLAADFRKLCIVFS